MQTNSRRVVVTGYGMITPIGKNSGETFENARNGVSGIDYISSFETGGLPCRIGGQVSDSWLGGFQSKRLQGIEKCSSRGLKLMMAAASEAVEMARLGSIEDRGTIGVSLGYHGENPSVEDLVRLYRHAGGDHWDIDGLTRDSAYSFFNFFRRKPDVATSILQILFDCKGPGFSVVSACAAGAQAIGEALGTIRSGKAEVVIAGGCESNVNFMGFVGFVLIRALAEKYSSPDKASRPFDRKRNGFVMSEGAGALILEALGHAEARGATILGEVLGYGSSADAFRITDIHPKGDGAFFAMQKALADAGLPAAAIEYINAHGTSTIQNDQIETLAIKRVLGERANLVPVSSNKSMIGHTIAAGGAIEAGLTLMGMNGSTLLPTINYEFPDPKCVLDYVPNIARSLEHGIAISNSFGFGGQNACLCLGKFRK
ncbi:MAG: beta-ketoacyl-[acyl-carrier-protein] synthase family protein [Syntrophobacteraceae bacterium]|nr:beta-ketoacyl-[acyl-carrier-protein] synthase family protein [Syntrophobacteraceae bacterium]